MKKSDKRQELRVTMDKGLADRVKATAASLGLSKSAYVRLAIIADVDNRERVKRLADMQGPFVGGR